VARAATAQAASRQTAAVTTVTAHRLTGTLAGGRPTIGAATGRAEHEAERPALIAGETALQETGLEETGLDETGLDETELDETELDETELEETVLDETVLDETERVAGGPAVTGALEQ